LGPGAQVRKHYKIHHRDKVKTAAHREKKNRHGQGGTPRQQGGMTRKGGTQAQKTIRKRKHVRGTMEGEDCTGGGLTCPNGGTTGLETTLRNIGRVRVTKNRYGKKKKSAITPGYKGKGRGHIGGWGDKNSDPGALTAWGLLNGHYCGLKRRGLSTGKEFKRQESLNWVRDKA